MGQDEVATTEDTLVSGGFFSSPHGRINFTFPKAQKVLTTVNPIWCSQGFEHIVIRGRSASTKSHVSLLRPNSHCHLIGTFIIASLGFNLSHKFVENSAIKRSTGISDSGTTCLLFALKFQVLDDTQHCIPFPQSSICLLLAE